MKRRAAAKGKFVSPHLLEEDQEFPLDRLLGEQSRVIAIRFPRAGVVGAAVVVEATEPCVQDHPHD